MGKGKGKGKGKGNLRGRYITSLQELESRNEHEVSAGGQEEDEQSGGDSDGNNSDLDFFMDGDDAGQAGASTDVSAAAAASTKDGLTERVILFEKEKPLLSADLVDVSNLNAQKPQHLKSKDMASAAPQQLSRREREFLEEKEAERNLRRLTALGMTPEARADLERLEEIREQRADDKLRREEDAREREAKAERTAAAAKVRLEGATEKLNSKSKKGKGKKKKPNRA